MGMMKMMKMIKIAIIDDEKYWREEIEKTLYECYDRDKIELDIYESGVEYLKKNNIYDITFVDVEMPDLDGFETIMSARKFNPEGIFIILTTHTEMSRKGYLVNAFRYIDKVHLKEEMPEAMDSAKVLLRKNIKINVSVISEGVQEIALKDIIYIETGRHFTMIYTKHGEKRCSNSMSEIEGMLSEEYFYRCHNAFIVNMDEINEFKNNMLVMSNGEKVEVSKRKISDFKKVYIKRQYVLANA